jgi:hypothetical protein
VSWQQIFDSIGYRWCEGCAVDFDHESGTVVAWADHDDVHWRKRRVTKAGIYKILRRIVWQTDTFEGLPAWRQIFLINHQVLAFARQARVRLPRKVFELDRARLRHELSGYTNEDIRRMTPSEQTDFRAARRWAARS